MLETNKNAVTVLYSGGDIQVPFVFYDAADLVVLYDTIRKTLNTDYTVTGAGNASGGKVKLTNAPASGTRVTVLRLIDFVQLLEIPSNGILPEGALNRALDRIVMMIQQLAERADRAVTYPAGTDKGIVLNIVDILRNVNAATGDARGSATAAAASATKAKESARQAEVAHQAALVEKERVHAAGNEEFTRVHDEGDAQVLRITRESTAILETAAGLVPNTDVCQVAPPEWASPAYGATINGGSLKVHPARMAYSADTLAATTFWMCSDPEGTDVVYPRHTEVVTDENNGLSHELHLHYLNTNTTYYPFCEQKSNKGAVSRVAAPLKVVTGDVLQFVAPPETLEPLEGQAYSGATMRMRLKPIVVDPSQPAQHTKTEYRVKFGDTEIVHKTITTNLLDEKLPFLERLKDFVLEVRVYDKVRGWSGWSTVNFKTNEKSSFVMSAPALGGTPNVFNGVYSIKSSLLCWGYVQSDSIDRKLYGFDVHTGDPTFCLDFTTGSGDNDFRISASCADGDNLICEGYKSSSKVHYLFSFNTIKKTMNWLKKSRLSAQRAWVTGGYLYIKGAIRRSDDYWFPAIYRVNKVTGEYISHAVLPYIFKQQGYIIHTSTSGGAAPSSRVTIAMTNQHGAYRNAKDVFIDSNAVRFGGVCSTPSTVYCAGGVESDDEHEVVFAMFDASSGRTIKLLTFAFAGIDKFYAAQESYTSVYVVRNKVYVVFNSSPSYLLEFDLAGTLLRAFTTSKGRAIENVAGHETGILLEIGYQAGYTWSARHIFSVEATGSLRNVSAENFYLTEIQLSELSMLDRTNSKSESSSSEFSSIPSISLSKTPLENANLGFTVVDNPLSISRTYI
ncbi:hypothetical protein [Halodesulfovibrio sp.]|jgi:hypothetical protein|uniref:hypothetical protein n=1 Tax=Halodesulfovibrio sp. TaxID=1912772 RepID=UPI0025D46450|nr:hypothetical protein [Halodesulfovibrio sp.]MCT4626967.1 hypothetical protein [Halodesulfovibrio sp.]